MVTEEQKVLNSLSVEDVNCVINLLEQTRLEKKRIFICGNGGSAATASHFVSDFNKGASLNREIKYDVECLSDNVPMMMAVANDISYEDIFIIPLKNKLSAGDVVIGISGSGNSENVIRAIQYANEAGAVTIGLTGYDGGKLKNLVQYNIHVNIDNMQIVEDVHLILDHLMMYVIMGDKNIC